MNCRAFEQLLLLRAHGQLGGVRRFWLDAHVRNCTSCREKWASWVLEKDAMRQALAPPPKQDPTAEQLRTAVAIRIRTEPRDAFPRTALASPPRNKPVRLLAVAVLVLALAGAVAALAAYNPIAAKMGIVPAEWRYGPDHCLPPMIGPTEHGIRSLPPIRHSPNPSAAVPANAKKAEQKCLPGLGKRLEDATGG